MVRHFRFDLPDDGLHTEIEATFRSDTGPIWEAAVKDDPTSFIVRACISTLDNGDGCTLYLAGGLVPAPVNEKAERAISALAFLGATMARSPDHRATAALYADGEMQDADRRIETLLPGLGYQPPLAPSDIERAVIVDEQDLCWRASAGDILRSLGPTFPVGFSLSPAEVSANYSSPR